MYAPSENRGSLTKLNAMKLNVYDLGYEPTDLHVTISDLMVATADHSDDSLDSAISDVLKTLRDRMGMDVVFCSEFVDGCRVFRQVETTGIRPTIAVGGSDLLDRASLPTHVKTPPLAHCLTNCLSPSGRTSAPLSC